jgi:hypothetical protein
MHSTPVKKIYRNPVLDDGEKWEVLMLKKNPETKQENFHPDAGPDG